MLHEQIRDRFLGALLGLLVGEALGAQFEGRAATDIQLSLGEAPTKMVGGGRHRLVPGEGTDDALQVLTVVDSFVTQREFDGIDICLGLINLWQTHPKGMGQHTSEVLERLSRDPEKWEYTGREVWYHSSGVVAGNGSLARCIVPALLYWNDLDQMIESTIRLCQITHYDPRVVEAALAINFLLIQCLHRRFSAELIEQTALFILATRKTPAYKSLAHDFNEAVLGEYSNFSPYPSYRDDRERVVTALRQIPKVKGTDLHTSGFAVHTMQLAVWNLIYSESFEQGVHRAVRIGGDSDTQGAITGALMGARFGLAHIPNYWLAPIRDRARIASKGELLLNASMRVEEEDFASGRRSPDASPPRIQ